MGQAATRRTRKTIAILLAGALLLFGTAALLTLSVAQRSRDWRAGAKQVATIQNWYPSDVQPFYHWLSETELLYMERVSNTVHLKKRNIQTGTITERGVLPDSVFRLQGPNELRISPDGNFLLWKVDPIAPQGGETERVGVIDLRTLRSGGPLKGWKLAPDEESFAFWFPDSQRWGTLLQRKGIRVRDRNKPGTETWLTGQGLSESSLIGVTPEGAVITLRSKTAPHRWRPHTFPLEIVRLVARNTTDTQLVPEVVSALQRRDGLSRETVLALSPNGKELLGKDTLFFPPWEMYVLGWIWALQNRMPSGLNAGRAEDRLWISNISDGKKQVVLVLLESDPNRFFESFQWTPDGNAVSFAYGGELYVRPIR